MDDLILEKKLKETLNKKSEEIGGSLADQRIRTRVFEAIEEEKNMSEFLNLKSIDISSITIIGTAINIIICATTR